jgi:hypothetical protein
MSSRPLGPYARVKVQLLAVKPPALVYQPLDQTQAVAPTAGLRQSREIVNVDIATPGKALSSVKPCNGNGSWRVLIKRADKSVTFRPLNVVDATNEGFFVSEVGPQCSHGFESQPGIWRKQLANHHRIVGTLVG